MQTLKLVLLLLQSAVILAGWLRERELAGVAREEALREMKDAISIKVKAAADARAAPHDSNAVDPNDRG